MVDTNSIVTNVNEKIVGAFTGINLLNILGWFFFIVLVIGGSLWYWNYHKNKKLFNKKITAWEKVGGDWSPVIRDLARTIRIGKSGLEILYLKKLKTWKIAYGGRVGKSDYYFYIMPDGYWYNGVPSADLYYMEKNNGLIPIVTTNPLMRGQYVALEKQIDSLVGEKPKFWDKYGGWIMSITFVLIAGVLLWLSYKQYAVVSGNLAGAVDKMASLAETLTKLTTNTQSMTNPSGLVPV